MSNVDTLLATLKKIYSVMFMLRITKLIFSYHTDLFKITPVTVIIVVICDIKKNTDIEMLYNILN